MALSDWFDARVPNGSGALDDAFARVADGFVENFEAGAELGASFAMALDGELVIDIRGGYVDRAKEAPWTESTLACVYSTGKAVLSFLVAREVSNGRLGYDDPVASYWPEFGANGKEQITLAQIMSHQAGLVALPEGTPPEIYLDWDATCEVIAAMAPLWEPGTANGYHPQTVGFIVGEVLRRVTGKTVGAHLRAEGHEIYCGMGPDEQARTSFMPKPPKPPDLGELNAVTQLAFLKPSSTPGGGVNRMDWMAAEIPGSNMHADARSLALMLFPMASNGIGVDGASVLSADAIGEAFAERIRGDDLVLPFHLSWSAGLMRNINRHFGPIENAFGHAGFGGSCVTIDPENRLTAAYVMNKMSPYLVGDPRAVRLIDAVYDAL